MKKIVLYVVILVLLTFLIPVVFTNTGRNSTMANSSGKIDDAQNSGKTQGESGNSVDNQGENADFKGKWENNYSKIKLLHAKTNTIEEIDLEEYLYRCGFSRNASQLRN